MCQGCEDLLEWERIVDQLVATQLPDLMSRPLDADILNGKRGNMIESEYIVVMPRVEGNLESGYCTTYYTDHKRFPKLLMAIRHGSEDLDQADDFLVGEVTGDRLLCLRWMNKLRDDREEVESAAISLGMKS